MRAIAQGPLPKFAPVLCLILFTGAAAHGQAPQGQSSSANPIDLDAKIEALAQSLQQIQGELKQSRADIQQLREMLAQVLQAQGTRTSNAAPQNQDEGPGAGIAPATEAGANGAQISKDDWQMLNAKVEEHEQVKVESASKYRLKLSGIALFNVFDTSGQVDNLDAPSAAAPRLAYGSGSVGASLRQSVLGLRGIGPKVFGASTSADLQVDFLNGSGSPYAGAGAGIVGLRIARVQFDWRNTSVAGGLETPFFSPNSPTSYLSLAVPAFSAGGNLWNWTPTVRAKRRIDWTSAELKVEAGFLDSAGYSISSTTNRVPTPGEASRQPVYAVRISGNNRMEDHGVVFGVSGVYIPLSFPGRTLYGSGAIADWKFPIVPKLQLSGAFFRGKGLDGFGGLAIPAIQPQAYPQYLYFTAPTLASIPVIGGWSQLKFTLTNRSELNLAGGLGQRNPGRLRQAARYDSLLASIPESNRGFFFNYIFRPRGDLVFSAEYRRFYTNTVDTTSIVAGQIGLAAGFLF